MADLNVSTGAPPAKHGKCSIYEGNNDAKGYSWLGAGRGGTVIGLGGGAPGLGGGGPGLDGGAANSKSSASFDTTSKPASTCVGGATFGLVGGGFAGCVDGLGGALTWRERGGGREGLAGFG